MALIPVVNEQDEIIGYKERAEIQKDDIYRIVSLRITNPQGQILIAQRAFTKKHAPGKRSPAVAGTVEKGETYEQNIRKEAKEELGLQDIELMPLFRSRRRNEHNYFAQRYGATIDWPIEKFVLCKEEVISIQWISREELDARVHAHPEEFTVNMEENMQNL